jgi:cytochrome c oxidase subunit 2
MLPDLVATAPAGSRVVDVHGEQFWWRVRYQLPDGNRVELANEIRLPVGEHAQFRLHSPDVIHSFWIPSVAGKMDMIPGRVTRLAVEPTRTGVFRGACAEYCGGSHALMNFYTIVEDRAAFDQWLLNQAAPAKAPTSPQAARGQQLFLMNGCGACHTIRGIAAAGLVGPDLTHVGSRHSLGAGVLPNTMGDFLRFISETERIKPGVHMPPFRMLPREDLLALATYLDGLE